jgi:hypothetical protein
MDFDHVRGVKEVILGSARVRGFARGYAVSLDRVLAEIDKCDVVCSNCHRERTHKRRIAALHDEDSDDE